MGYSVAQDRCILVQKFAGIPGKSDYNRKHKSRGNYCLQRAYVSLALVNISRVVLSCCKYATGGYIERILLRRITHSSARLGIIPEKCKRPLPARSEVAFTRRHLTSKCTSENLTWSSPPGSQHRDPTTIICKYFRMLSMYTGKSCTLTLTQMHKDFIDTNLHRLVYHLSIRSFSLLSLSPLLRIFLPANPFSRHNPNRRSKMLLKTAKLCIRKASAPTVCTDQSTSGTCQA